VVAVVQGVLGGRCDEVLGGRSGRGRVWWSPPMTCWVDALVEGMLGGRCDEVLGGRTV